MLYPIELGVFGHAEYKLHSLESEVAVAKIDILSYPHTILKEATF